MKELKKIKGKF